MPLWLAGALRFVPPAVLCAIIFPEILMSNGTLAINAANHRLIAAVLATVVAVASRSLFLTIAVGMAALWAVAWLAG